MIELTSEQKDEFLTKHLRHRLTLLRTLRERKLDNYTYTKQGDIYRCVKDSNLIAVRLLLDFLGLKCDNDGEKLISSNGYRRPDDVKIDQFIDRLLIPSDVPILMHRVLAGVYKRADKELAHLTLIYNNEFNDEDNLILAATHIESLLKRFLYDALDKEFPEMD